MVVQEPTLLFITKQNKANKFTMIGLCFASENMLTILIWTTWSKREKVFHSSFEEWGTCLNTWIVAVKNLGFRKEWQSLILCICLKFEIHILQWEWYTYCAQQIFFLQYKETWYSVSRSNLEERTTWNKETIGFNFLDPFHSGVYVDLLAQCGSIFIRYA